MQIVEAVYALAKQLPNSELFGVSLQIRKAAISMPSNIAEGCSRSSNKEVAHFLEISLGSSFELETQLLACSRIGYFTENEIAPVLAQLQVFQKKSNNYLK